MVLKETQRYDEFRTVDRMRDMVTDYVRRKSYIPLLIRAFGRTKYATLLLSAYKSCQTWIVLTLVGMTIGLIAGILNIVTSWLSDIKVGYCSRGFYLNKTFCCWGLGLESCNDWHTWTSFFPIKYIVFVSLSVVFAWTAAYLVKVYSKTAAGSGISEIKCIISGFLLKDFLGPVTLAIKSIGLPLAIASGLSVGKEGPSVHYAVCAASVITQFFYKYRTSNHRSTEMLIAGSAAGVAVAFGSPIGGVLFSLEEMSSSFHLRTIWRSYFCALIATWTLAAVNPFRTGQLVMFSVRYQHTWQFFEVLFFVIIGVLGGMYGGFVIKWNLFIQGFRKKYLANYAIQEAMVLSFITALICYFNSFLRIDMTESMEILFRQCNDIVDHYDHICDANRRGWIITSLLSATFIRTILVIVSYGCKVPAGIFVPSMAIGATFGRAIGIVVQILQEKFPNAMLFASCRNLEVCITPGSYAFLGAASALSGIMHITVTVVVVMFELTGAVSYIVPTMIVIGATKATSTWLSSGGLPTEEGGIADRMIYFSGFPVIDAKENPYFNVPVKSAMTRDPVTLDFQSTAETARAVLNEHPYRGFPVVRDNYIEGFVSREDLEKMISEDMRLAEVIDTSPVKASSSTDLEVIFRIFATVGPRVILIHEHDSLLGLITTKDNKYQASDEET
ncbi:hypothetical protein CANCADRAFT_3125 [Tortispora caseinolytica NRRL Y-17796]|uniref:Chloride channel protein n=1 Tax=Tortispora caseinolytica NRRL Y-17796 TaxID=767744 RepID=A0A1E4TI38_9ASCO|nr:hypothetical protein CANCADRAFT_3125 [Tortispora caseinolytica NRRL Y-17796]